MHLVYQTQKPIWRIFPDVESRLIALECRDRSDATTELSVLNLADQSIVATKNFDKENTLLYFVNQTIFIGRVHFHHEISLPQSIAIFDVNLAIISEIPGVYFHSVLKKNSAFELIFSLHGKLYTIPFTSFWNNEEVETIEVDARYFEKNKLKPLAQTQHYPTTHRYYTKLAAFIDQKAAIRTNQTIVYAENEHFLVCSFLTNSYQNHLLISDRKGNILFQDVIATTVKQALEVMLFEQYVIWTNQTELHVFSAI